MLAPVVPLPRKPQPRPTSQPTTCDGDGEVTLDRTPSPRAESWETMATTQTAPAVSAPQRLTFMTMTAMVVGSMVGAGVFSLPRRFAQQTGVAGALIAWVIAGTRLLLGVRLLGQRVRGERDVLGAHHV